MDMSIETGTTGPLPRDSESDYDKDMAEQSMEGVTQEVAVADPDGRVIGGPWLIASAQVAEVVLRVQSAHPTATVLIDGKPASAAPAVPVEAAAAMAMPPLPGDPHGIQAGVNMSNAMLWASFDRTLTLQGWMIQQATTFTHDLIEQNRKLADQAGDLQARFQQAMQRIDLMETEKKLIEHDLMARRLSRHAIAQNRAEEEASRPPPPPGQPWIDELIAGVSAFLGAQRQPPKDWPRN